MSSNFFPRLAFSPRKQTAFMEKVFLKSSSSADILGSLVGVSPRTIRDWKREKYRISKYAANIFCQNFKLALPEPENILIEKWAKIKKEGNRKGGHAHFKKHGSPGTPEGRSKGGKKAIKILREKGIFTTAKNFKYPRYCKKLAEWVGVVLGDGGITPYQVNICLNSISDAKYIPFVRSLSKELFEEEPRLYNRKNENATYVCLSGVNLVKILQEIGLRIGNKVKQQVGVPQWINESADYKTRCLRGLMDTDGGIFWHKYRVNGKTYSYKKICFSNRSLPLLHFVSNTLEELGFTPKIAGRVEKKHVWLYNSNEVAKYLKVVGSSNPRLLRFV